MINHHIWCKVAHFWSWSIQSNGEMSGIVREIQKEMKYGLKPLISSQKSKVAIEILKLSLLQKNSYLKWWFSIICYVKRLCWNTRKYQVTVSRMTRDDCSMCLVQTQKKQHWIRGGNPSSTVYSGCPIIHCL